MSEDACGVAPVEGGRYCEASDAEDCGIGRSRGRSCGDSRVGPAQMTPLAWAIYFIAIVSVLYEPVRSAIAYTFGQAVGGVGGVGGLTNQWTPKDTCTTNTLGPDAPWCFEKGIIFGYTPFACLVMGLVTAPILVAATVMHIGRWRPSTAVKVMVECGDDSRGFWITLVWHSMSALWFVVPLSAYLSSPFYQTDVWHVLCAIAITSAYPLSWHLSFVAIPASSSSVLVQLLELRSDETLKALHVHAAWSTCCWAAAHAGGELVYIASQGQLISSFSILTAPAGDDALLFFFGLLAATALVAHASLAWMRRHPGWKLSFKRNHRIGAVLLLLAASAHWWPFVFFLLPSIVLSAANAAGARALSAPEGARDTASSGAATPLALAMATLGAVVAISGVWTLRQCVMLIREDDFSTPFVFPPATIAAGWLAARASAAAVFRNANCLQEDAAREDESLGKRCRSSPLLASPTTSEAVETSPLLVVTS